MAYNYGYKSEGTILDGFLKWIQDNHYEWYKANVSKISDLNPTLQRLENSQNQTNLQQKKLKKTQFTSQKIQALKKLMIILTEYWRLTLTFIIVLVACKYAKTSRFKTNLAEFTNN